MHKLHGRYKVLHGLAAWYYAPTSRLAPDDSELLATTAIRRGYAAEILIILAALLAFFGAVWLGLGTDNYSDIEMYRSISWGSVAVNPIFNRYPTWGLLMYPLLLALPLWLAHLAVIVTHTLAALLLFRLLCALSFDDVTATLAALLFLLWPAHAETLFWLAGSMGTFGVCTVLGGALLLRHGRTIVALLLIFVGMLFSEGIFLPALFLIGIVLWHQRVRPTRAVLLLGALVVGYAAFQGFRLVVSRAGDFVPYNIGVSHIPKNAVFLVLMTLGLASSRDVVWMWLASKYPIDVGVLLSPRWLILALTLALPATMALHRLPASPLAFHPFRALRPAIGVVLAGYASALVIFLVLVGNEMQTRYTCAAVAYLSVLLALPLGWLLAQRRQTLVYAGLACTALLLGWSLYRSWSNIWVNAYPARIVSERLINDVRQTYRETGVLRILLVNEPRAVGNAYAVGRDWGYAAAARLYVSPHLHLSSEALLALVNRTDFASGSRFADEPCVFLGWRAGQRIVERQILVPAKRLVLNCLTGQAELSTRSVHPTLSLASQAQVSRENLREFPSTYTDWPDPN